MTMKSLELHELVKFYHSVYSVSWFRGRLTREN